MNLSEIEKLTNAKCVVGEDILNGGNSVMPNEKYVGLNIVYLIVKKNG